MSLMQERPYWGNKSLRALCVPRRFIDVCSEMNQLDIITMSSLKILFNIVMCLTIARQRLGKHNPAEANARNNRTSISRQRINKYASLIIECKVVTKKC
jgi:hypothetical protein